MRMDFRYGWESKLPTGNRAWLKKTRAFKLLHPTWVRQFFHQRFPRMKIADYKNCAVSDMIISTCLIKCFPPAEY